MFACLSFCFFFGLFAVYGWIVSFDCLKFLNFFRRLEMFSIIPISLSLPFTLTSATPTLLSLTSFSEAIAMSASTAKLSNDVLSGVVAKCARIDAGICRIKACRITALPTTAVVPNPAVFCRRRRKREGMSVPHFPPGVVKARLSINTPLRLMYNARFTSRLPET